MTAPRLENISVCVFDAYGTLFDVNAAAAACQDELGDKWQPLAEMWRGRQLQYTWLRALMGEHKPFREVTGDALDFAMASLGLEDEGLRARLADLYMQLDCYPEVPGVLRRLKAAGLKTAILSNGSPDMLQAAVENAGIADVLDAVLSVEQVGVFKPHPTVYQMAEKEFGIPPGKMSFQSSNAWDAHAASHFGFNVVWVNRFGQAPERLPGRPDVELETLEDLPKIVGVE